MRRAVARGFSRASAGANIVNLSELRSRVARAVSGPCDHGAIMSGRSVYHLDVDAGAIEGATIALVPGDPGRVPHLAGQAPFDGGREIACKREYRTWIAYMRGTPVLVTSTGIGGPSASIAIDELAQLGVRTFIRVGTTGAIQRRVNVGDVVITTGAVRLDGASTHYAPIEQ